MEDVAVMIFRLIIIGFVLLGVVKRDKRKRMTGRDSGSDNGPERPTEIPWEQLPRPNAAPQSVDAVEVDPDDAEAMAAEYYKKRQPYTPVSHTAARTHAADTTSAAAHGKAAEWAEGAKRAEGGDGCENSENGGILGRFDLRDAVLYSEILKPKFDEQA